MMWGNPKVADYRFRKYEQTWLTGQSLQRGLLVLQILLPC